MSVAVMKGGKPEYAAHAGKMKWETMEDKPFSNIDSANFEVVDDNLKLIPAIINPVNLVANSYGDVYIPAKPYNKGDLCIYDNRLWKSLAENQGQTPSETSMFWKETSLTKEFDNVTDDISTLNNNLGLPSSASAVTGITAFEKIKTLNTNKANLISGVQSSLEVKQCIEQNWLDFDIGSYMFRFKADSQFLGIVFKLSNLYGCILIMNYNTLLYGGISGTTWTWKSLK